MKKLITKFFVAAGFVALFTTANAQIGVRIGANLANASVSGDDEGEFKMRPGFQQVCFIRSKVVALPFNLKSTLPNKAPNSVLTF